jgi:hypothetical protein
VQIQKDTQKNKISNEDTTAVPEEELVTVDGLQFKRYQIQFMEAFTKLEGYENLQEWIQDTILLDLL